MAELTPSERLQPCLLDRLTDDHPETAQESRDQRVVSMALYRQAVLRDLVWLFNTPARPGDDEIYEYEEAAASVLNFGSRDLCGLTAAGLSTEDLEKSLSQAIRRFEPRILPSSLSIQTSTSGDKMDHQAVTFEINGTLWAQPTPDQLYIKTEIDLETGHCNLVRKSNG
ncbi:MAG: type VI secretion system baseplate subunit TssE [Lentisphaerota bacterium]